MKSKIFVLLAGILIFSACKESILDIKNPAAYNEETYFKTTNELNKGIMATYAVLLQRGMNARDWYYAFDLMASDAMKNTFLPGDEAAMYGMTFDNTGVYPGWLWSSNFRMRTRACIMVEKSMAFTPANQTESDNKNWVIGEGYFLKSLAYYNLVRIFGSVPYADTWSQIKDPANLKLPRSPEDTIYNHIEKDLTKAIALLPESWSSEWLGRATKYAAMGLLGKVLVTEGKYEEALVQLKAVETSGKYKLWQQTGGNKNTGYFQNFTQPDNSNSPESLFDVHHKFYGWGEGNAYFMFGGAETWGGKATNSGRAMEYGFNDWWNTFVSTGAAQSFSYSINGNANYIDPRGALTFYGDPNQGGDGDWFMGAYDFHKNKTSWKKYNHYEFREKEGQPDSEIATQLMRYSDILLLIAECNIFKATPDFAMATQYINQVRSRVGATSYAAAPADLASAFNILKLERRLELCGEQQRWFDLKRWQLLGKVPGFKMIDEINKDRALDAFNLPSPMPEKYIWLPIPKQELDNNPQMKNDLHFPDWN